MYCCNCGHLLRSDDIFCGQCGAKKKEDSHTKAVAENGSERDIVEHYFHKGYQYESILMFLAKYHQIEWSLSTLKRRLREYGMQRKGADLCEDNVREVIQGEVKGPGTLMGYRSMWNRLKIKHNLTVPRDTVMRLLHEVDPVAAAQRQARRLTRRKYISGGPNAAWHLDGYDKLKPYGFPIHGCVDGFSRKVLWLKVGRSNNNPVITGSYFVSALQKYGCCPAIVQTDCGTENGIIAGIQSALKKDLKAHRYGSSPSNQRIENWWSHYKRGYSAWIIDYFKGLVDSGLLVLGSHVHMECAWFVYSGLLQTDLDNVVQEWNNHLIRKSRHAAVSGIPDQLYHIPEWFGYFDRGEEISENKIRSILDQYDVHAEAAQALDCDDKDLVTYFRYVVERNNMGYPPQDWANACQLFANIVQAADI